VINLRIKAWGLGLCLLSMVVTPYVAYAQDSFKLKAALTYNLAKFVKWLPESVPKDTWQLCYFGQEYDLGFEQLKNKKLQGKALQAKRLREVSQASSCQIVYIDANHRKLLPRLFIALKNKPILTISDSSGFVDQGGMLEIISIESKLRFKANQFEMEKTGLTMSSRALRLALEVKN